MIRLTLAELGDLLPEPENDAELRRRIAAHLGITLVSYEREACWEMPTRVRRGTSESWGSIRRRIYHRDSGKCHVCGFGIVEDDYECGHIIDRDRGGTDRDANLTAMHAVCNRRKPPHETREEYLYWVHELRASMWAAAERWIATRAAP